MVRGIGGKLEAVQEREAETTLGWQDGGLMPVRST